MTNGPVDSEKISFAVENHNRTRINGTSSRVEYFWNAQYRMQYTVTLFYNLRLYRES